MEIIKVLLISTLFSLVTGQLLRFPFFLNYGAINVTDILVFVVDFVFLIYTLSIRKSLKLSKSVIIPLLSFTFLAVASNILSLSLFSQVQVVSSSLFLLRFLGYFLISQVILNIVTKNKVERWQNLIEFIGVIFIALGFLQLIFFPDLSSLTVYGWDPHQRRIVSTILDPNFAGFIFTIIFALASSLFLFNDKKSELFPRKVHFLIALSAIVAVVLTFSRSSYLALMVVILTIGFLKSPKMLICSILFLALTLGLIPQARSRIFGALSIDDTSQARIISWKNALTITSHNPIFGVGFNNYRFAQAKYQLFAYPGQIEIHSASGVDSSFLLVAATTGISGLFMFLLLIFSVLKTIISKLKGRSINLAMLSIFLALLVHSQFVNSFFFPQISVLFWIIFGLSQIDDH